MDVDIPFYVGVALIGYSAFGILGAGVYLLVATTAVVALQVGLSEESE